MKTLLLLLLVIASFFAYQERQNISALQAELNATHQQIEDAQNKLTALQDEIAKVQRELASASAGWESPLSTSHLGSSRLDGTLRGK